MPNFFSWAPDVLARETAAYSVRIIVLLIRDVFLSRRNYKAKVMYLVAILGAAIFRNLALL